MHKSRLAHGCLQSVDNGSRVLWKGLLHAQSFAGRDAEKQGAHQEDPAVGVVSHILDGLLPLLGSALAIQALVANIKLVQGQLHHVQHVSPHAEGHNLLPCMAAKAWMQGAKVSSFEALGGIVHKLVVLRGIAIGRCSKGIPQSAFLII